MKSIAILVLAAVAGTLCADMRAEEVRGKDVRPPDGGAAFAVRSYVTRGDLAASRFWTLPTIALIALDGAAKAADGFATRKNIDGGGDEYDPLARPFVHTTSVQVVATGVLFGAEVAAAYWLHRRHHNNMGRGVLVGGAVMNGLGAASSIKNHVGIW
jgi:hypothetical protein